MTDSKTLATYAEMAGDYARLTGKSAIKDPMFDAFLTDLSPGGHILDLGCGPGQYSAAMADAGYQVTATDAVAEMVRLAAQHPGVKAVQATFDDIAGQDIYDGIWANFSLLHAPRAAMPDYLAALRTALKPGGLFHIGLKTGTGEKRDGIDRLYTYYTSPEINDLLSTAGFTPLEQSAGNSVGLDGVRADWIAVRARG